jgi:glycosyl transferase family 25
VLNKIPIFVINLDRDPDRLVDMRREFSRVGLSFERISGILGTDLPPNLRPFFFDAAGSVASPLRKGEIGCYASHIKTWMHFADKDQSSASLVCEDDIRLPDDMPELLGRIIASAPKGWDIIRLSSNSKRPVSFVMPLVNEYQLVRYWKISVLAGAYLISRAGARKMLRAGLRKNPIDVDISRPWLFGLDAYGVVPTPIIQNIAESTIDKLDDREKVRKRRTQVKRILRRMGNLPIKIRHSIYNLETMGPIDWTICLFLNTRRKITGHQFDWSRKAYGIARSGVVAAPPAGGIAEGAGTGLPRTSLLRETSPRPGRYNSTD